MAKKPRIPLNAEQTGLNAAFAGLDLSGLPSGPAESLQPPAAEKFGPKPGRVVLRREKAGRGGKTVTVVKGLALDAVALAALGKQLRSACGSGGTVKDGVIEVQGDHCDLVLDVLGKQGHRAKRAGG